MKKKKRKKDKKIDKLKGYEEIEKEEIKILRRLTVEESLKLTEMLLRELSKWKK